MDGPPKSGRSVGTFFFFLVAKNSPKNTEFSKKNLTFFAEIFWENILIYFQTVSAKILQLVKKMADFTRLWQKKKKKRNSPKTKKNRLVVHVKPVFYFFHCHMYINYGGNICKI